MDALQASLLRGVCRNDIETEPFPHVVVRDAMPPAAYRDFAAHTPHYEAVSWEGNRTSNRRFSSPAPFLLADPRVHDTWKSLVRTHTSPGFFAEIVALFASFWSLANPGLVDRFGPLDALRAGRVEGHDDDGSAAAFHSFDVLLDARFEVNTPVHGAASSVRRGHLDNPNRVYSGLFYLRAPEDDSAGGDLELYRWKAGRPGATDRHEIPDAELESVKRVPYAANTLVLFPNGPNALHGVTPRHPTPHQRSYLFLTAVVAEDVF